MDFFTQIQINRRFTERLWHNRSLLHEPLNYSLFTIHCLKNKRRKTKNKTIKTELNKTKQQIQRVFADRAIQHE